MNLQRLKFAWARGARIEIYQPSKDAWHAYSKPGAISLDYISVRIELRTHPDDEHLAYGPLSSALRELAIDPMGEPAGYNARDAARLFEQQIWYEADARSSTVDEYRMFRLFVAEYLADEGL